MSKVATATTNFHYATELKKRGFKTAVHALPKEGIDMVNSLLQRAVPSYEVANQVNTQFGKYVKGIGLKPISKASVETYRKRYFNKDEVLEKLIEQDPAIQLKKDLVEDKYLKLLEDFDPVEQMFVVIKKVKALIVDKDSQLENNEMGIVDKGRSAERKNYFDMCAKLSDVLIAKGIIEAKVPEPIKVETEISFADDDGESNKDLTLRVADLLQELKHDNTIKKGKRIGVGGRKE